MKLVHNSSTKQPFWGPGMGQLMRFAIVGVLNTAVDWLVYFILTRWVLGIFASYTLAKGISYCAGVLNSYFWNKSWTFRSQANAREVFIPFVLMTLLAVGLNTGIMYVTSAMLHWPEPVSLALATAAAFVWNFTTNKYVVFKSTVPIISS